MLLAIAVITSFIYLAHPFERGTTAFIAANVVIYIAVLLPMFVTCFKAYRLYGWKSPEGRVWLIITLAMCVMLASIIFFDTPAVYIPLFFVVYFLAGTAFVLKIRFSQVELTGYKFGLSIFGGGLSVGIATTVFLVTIEQMEIVFVTEHLQYIIFFIVDGVMITLSLVIAFYCGGMISKGWYILAAGIGMIAVSDPFYAVIEVKNQYYTGHPIDLVVCLAFLLLAYAAYYMRRKHLKLIEGFM